MTLADLAKTLLLGDIWVPIFERNLERIYAETAALQRVREELEALRLTPKV